MNNYSNQPTDLAYDLRQTYAKIVGEHLVDVAEARKADYYFGWYKSLEDLYTIVVHKFKKDSEKKEEEYKKLKNVIVNLANTYVASWTGLTKTPEECFKIEAALKEMEKFLYREMDAAKMFGDAGRIPGL